jgi:HEAT repeat protein
LGISKRPEALPKLRSAIESPDAATRLVALSALSELGLAEALPLLARATDDADEGVRIAAAGFLAARSDLGATNELLGLLGKDPTRQSLIHALARPAPGRVAAIAAAFQHADDALAESLVASLSRMQTEEARQAVALALDSTNDAARRAAASALVAMQDPASGTLLERAALSDPDAEVRRICATALRKH